MLIFSSKRLASFSYLAAFVLPHIQLFLTVDSYTFRSNKVSKTSFTQVGSNNYSSFFIQPVFRKDIKDIAGLSMSLSSASQKKIEENPTEELSDLPSLETLQSVLQVAIKASRAAGEIILGNAGGAEVTNRKANSRDLLTLIDPLCEQTIRDTVLATFPDHDFLGEEMVSPGKEASAAALESKLDTSEWLWIVDPIGTFSFG